MDYDTIEFTVADGVAIITLARPAVMNALNSRMRDEIRRAVLAGGEMARAVVLTGAGRAFCSGQDLGDAAQAIGDLGQVLRDEYEPMLKALSDCPVPVIAAVNGTAAGAGASLALAADVVIAAQSASFIQAFTRIGLMPDAGATWQLPRRIGLARAMGAALFGEPITAEEALAMGLIWEAVPDDGFEAHWRARAAQLAAGPTVAYRAIRQAMRAGVSGSYDEQLRIEADWQAKCGQTRDFREGIAAFVEKRPARFEGR
ncbi:enoyl-CoA hydratase-related protein [Halodurantibacterium flavum]|uniref:Enoyl-CoA hydratase-related protein n=1 Tax=Halodurantibacterium flavum TaxID=1382802 RepID=A0ABW4S5A8_9RHOB